MERQEEYELRNLIYAEIEKDVKNIFTKTYKNLGNSFSNKILYPITALELAFKKQSEKSILEGMFDNELLNLVNPLREAVYWYIRQILLVDSNLRFTSLKTPSESSNFEYSFIEFVLQLYDEHKRAEQIHIMRECSTKVKLQQENERLFSFYFPVISDKYNKEMLYYYGMDDKLNSQKEKELFIECEQYLHNKFDVTVLIEKPNKLNIYLNILNNMETKIDLKYYNYCKQRITSDICKISFTALSSEYEETKMPVINSKEELVSVLALFYYLSRLCMQKYMLKSGTYQSNIEYYCKYDLSKLIAVAKQIGIAGDILKNYIDYFSLDPKIVEGNFTEFPLLIIKNVVIWIPSSFVLNDFQFSIVNGHYYKNVRFINKDETVSQSIVDYIIAHSEKYENIVHANNTLYNVIGETYNGKDLKSDIDVALFDLSSNTLLIIECKWKENVYQNKDEYVHIEDALKKIYTRQLEKHQYYLNISEKNKSALFNYTIDFSKIDNLDMLYLFVDKRIQFHENENNRHAIPIFMLAYLFEKYSNKKHLYLNKVFEEIRSMSSNITYERVKLKQPVKIGSITVI